MSKQIQKSLHECLSKMKISHKQIQFPIRSCRRPKTPSFAAPGKEKENDVETVTLSDIDDFLFENFKSLYREEDDYGEESESEEEGISRRGFGPKTASFQYDDSPMLPGDPPPENLCRSARFFVASGSSSSRIGASSSSANDASEYGGDPVTASEYGGDPATASEDGGERTAPDDFIALLTYSPNPYEDFRRSMQEMVDARAEHNGKVDWKFLEELLFCYLDLNNKKSYRYILRAYVDLIVVMRENSGKAPPPIRPPVGGPAWRKHIN